MNNKRLFLSSFILKVLAIVFMTIDHIGALILVHIDGLETLTYITRVIGRFSLPLFCFLICEGIKYTKSKFKYALRLGISALLMAGIIFIFEIKYADNIFIDLFLGAAFLSCLQMDKSKKLYCLIPLSIIITLVILPMIYGKFPRAISLAYNFYGIVMIIGFYGMGQLSNIYHKYLASKIGMDADVFEDALPKQKLNNLLNLGFIIVYSLICWLINYLTNNQLSIIISSMSIQIYAMFAGFIILFYSGKPGFRALWWKYGCYLYYPIHVAIIYMVYLII